MPLGDERRESRQERRLRSRGTLGRGHGAMISKVAERRSQIADRGSVFSAHLRSAICHLRSDSRLLSGVTRNPAPDEPIHDHLFRPVRAAPRHPSGHEAGVAAEPRRADLDGAGRRGQKSKGDPVIPSTRIAQARHRRRDTGEKKRSIVPPLPAAAGRGPG